MMSRSDAVWSEQGTTPDAIEAALRSLLVERHTESDEYVPARVLNMIAFVEDEWSGEIANRLRGVGRYAASRLIVLSYERGRQRLDARASIASDSDPAPGELALLRETVIVKLGERHLDDLATIADPLVVTDMPTLLWAPHGHYEEIGELLSLAQAMLIDSVTVPTWREAIDQATALAEKLYVVDLAWLRSTPWRERMAASFDGQRLRPELYELAAVTVRHHPDSTVAGMLFLGWLASRLGWALEHAEIAHEPGEKGLLTDTAKANGREIALRLQVDATMPVPGLAGLDVTTTSGFSLGLNRGPGGLQAHRRDAQGAESEWTLLGASRGEGGILGEGIRQALLRDPTYGPALHAAYEMLPVQEAA